MNDQQEARDFADVMLAYASGKTIEYRIRYTEFGEPGSLWSDHPEIPAWDWSRFEYRVKPQPMEIEVWVHPDGRQFMDSEHDGWTKKKFREVIEE